MRPVFLIGYMGCGKTTVGRELARELGVAFIDLDEFIEARCGLKIVEIFDEMGENRFRELETEALRDVAAMSDVVIATGGGTPCHGDNMALINRSGMSVWLTTGAERIAARLRLPDQQATRPKLAGLSPEAILQLTREELAARTPYYSQAQLHFDSTDIETARTTRRTARRLAALLRNTN